MLGVSCSSAGVFTIGDVQVLLDGFRAFLPRIPSSAAPPQIDLSRDLPVVQALMLLRC